MQYNFRCGRGAQLPVLTRLGSGSIPTEGIQVYPSNGEPGMCPAQFTYIGLWLPCEQAGFHENPFGLYNLPFLLLRGNVVKKEKIKNPGVHKEQTETQVLVSRVVKS